MARPTPTHATSAIDASAATRVVALAMFRHASRHGTWGLMEKAWLSNLLDVGDLVRQVDDPLTALFVIGKAGRPIAKLVRFERPVEPREPGALRGQITISDDFEDLPEDYATAFGME